MENKKQSKSPLFLTILFLTVLAMAQQAIHSYKAYNFLLGQDTRASTEFIKHLFTAHQITISPIAWLLVSYLGLFFFFAAIIYAIAKLTSQILKLNDTKEFLFGLILWFIATNFVLIANSYYFPHSNFAFHINETLLLIIMLLLGIFLFAVTTSAIISLFKKHPLLSTIGTIIIIVAFYLYLHPSTTKYVPPSEKPNVIIIGLDSIRPDHLKFYSNANIKSPNINQFFEKSTVFSQAYSPLGRTYAAWAGILQGQHPKNSGVRENLINPFDLKLDKTLPAILRRHGYQTIFATDSRQFSLINKRFGFDKIVGHEMGVYDFIFSTLNDFPLSNLIMNTPLGKLLFPYNYANRMSYVNYYPRTFTQFVQRQLAHRQNKPLFLAIHHVLTHWPFMWAKDNQDEQLDAPKKFINTIERIDDQFTQLIKILKQDNILKNAIVFVISDHGLGLSLPGDRIVSYPNQVGDKKHTKLIPTYAYSESVHKEGMPYTGIDTSNGEGTDVLAFNKQNNIIFAIRTFGMSLENSTKTFSYPIALYDILPTVLDVLKIPKKQTSDGISLKPFIIDHNTENLAQRPVFFETGIWMPLFNQQDLRNGTAGKYMLDKVKELFTFVPNKNLLIAKKTVIKNLFKSKQRGILDKDWFLAYYPKSFTIQSHIVSEKVAAHMKCGFIDKYGAEKKHKVICYEFIKNSTPFYVLVNAKTKKWTMDFDSEFAKQSPLKELTEKLKDFYKGEI